MIRYFIRSFIDWCFRRRSTGLTLIRIGVSLLALVLIGLTVGITIPTSDGPFIFNWDSSSNTDVLSLVVCFVAFVLIVIGVFLLIQDIRQESRKKVIVIEVRGLRDWHGQSLELAVPSSVPGRREQLLVDLRQGVIDGQINSPETAIRRIENLPYDIARRCDGLNRSDISFVLGGLAPVPFLFLLGVIIDDESHTTIMDWDRECLKWSSLSDEDDGKRFIVTGLSTLNQNVKRVALCVSASYDVLEADVRIVEPVLPIIKVELEDRNTNSHWSEKKQQQLAQQFLDIVMRLAQQGVTDISLFLAAPASLSMRLGTVYDKRNLPHIEINQYERSDSKRFPWAIQVPVAGVLHAKLKCR